MRTRAHAREPLPSPQADRLAAAEARADLAEARLQGVLDALPEGVVLLDADGCYITWNARYAEIYHRSADLFRRGAPLIDALRAGVARGDYPEAAGQEEAWLQRRQAQILAATSRFEQQLSDGSCLLVEDRRTANGEIVGLRIDITEMKRQTDELAEAVHAAQGANAAKSAFLATMSHEVRTPLNGILGMAQAMGRDALSPVQRERLEIIERSGTALLAMLNDLLDLSKVEAGKLELELVEFDLSDLVRGAYATFTEIAAGKGLAFEVDISAAEGRYLGDPTRIRQILYNLISNAVKFTEHGRVDVAARWSEGWLAVEVSDTGIGIAPEHQPHLFDRFAQVDASTTRKYGGTGLGLAICRQLAELMGGEITVASRAGHGSRFQLRIPIGRADAPVAPPAPPPPGTAELRLRVLAAEDNPVNQLVLKTLLDQVGVQPTVVSDGAEAVDAWTHGDWDLVLMDIQMPRMDGLTAATRIRQLETTLRRPRTPIVALTANAMSHQVDQYRAADMDGHLAKPLSAADLYAVLLTVAEDAEP